jgi:hypothetical protein
MAAHTHATHHWYSPAECAAMLLGVRHGEYYRAPCPLHPGNPTSLSIREGRDSTGNPLTLLHCFAHHCTIEDICAAIGIEVRELFCIHPDYARATRNVPRARSPRINRLKYMEEPTPDDIVQLFLEELIVSDPQFIQTCAPARQQMWALATASPKAKEALTKALYLGHLSPAPFWQTLAAEMER